MFAVADIGPSKTHIPDPKSPLFPLEFKPRPMNEKSIGRSAKPPALEEDGGSVLFLLAWELLSQIV